MTDDFWPDDIGIVEIKAPSVILREQAAKLGQRTKNIVLAEIVYRPYPYNTYGETILVYDFKIVAPVLKNYRYTLFEIIHDASQLYPLDFAADDDLLKEIESTDFPIKEGYKHKPSILVVDEASFLAILVRILNATKTRRIVASLLAQSQGLPSSPSEDEIGI